MFEVPQDYSNPSSGTIQLFARSVIRHEKPAAFPTEESRSKSSQKPWFVYLQGGPGCECKAPQDFPLTNAILDRGCKYLSLEYLIHLVDFEVR